MGVRKGKLIRAVERAENDGLIPCGGEDAGEVEEKLPRRYVMTAAFLRMRAAERFGQHPFVFGDGLGGGELAMLLQYERVREMQEAAEIAARR